MATGGQPSSPEPRDPEPRYPEPRDPGPRDPEPRDPVTSLTDCPHCRSLCLGPSVLPCGHVLCRKCLHDVLQLVEAGCPRCEQPLRPAKDKTLTTNQLIQQMGTDPVIEHLVLKQLERDGDIRCLNCPNKKAANVCLDCHDYYCEVCSVHHLRGRYAKDHVLRQIPQALQNASSEASTTTFRPSSVVSTSSEDCISNTGEQPSDEISNEAYPGRVEEWEEWLQKQKDLLQQASSDHQEVITTLRNIVSLGQKLADRVSAHRQVIDTYHQHLSCLDATQREDPGSFAVKQRGSDVSMDLKTESLEKRLWEVMEVHHCPSIDTPKMIVEQLTQLLPPPEDADTENSGSSSETPEEAAASSTQASSATPETPATQDDTPTPTPKPDVDLMSARRKEVFQFSPRTSEDKENPSITDIVCLSDRLVLTDLYNSKVKVMKVKPPHDLSASINVPETPRRLAVLPDGLVAMTTFKPLIYLMEVTQTSLEVKSRIQTARQYAGIGGLSEGLLVVSSRRGYPSPATVDVVNREGELVVTLTDRSVEMGSPDYLCLSGDQHILVSDWKLHVVHKIDVNSGQVAKTIHHPHMKDPRRVCADSSGNIFVACCQSECVTLRSSGGEWKQLLTASLHSGMKKAIPQAMCLTASGHLVVAWAESFSEPSSVVICYKFT